jgi:hypothetical protein
LHKGPLGQQGLNIRYIETNTGFKDNFTLNNRSWLLYFDIIATHSIEMSDQESTPNDINNDDESRKRTFDEISSGNEDIPKHQQEPLGPAADTSLAQSCYDNDEESELRRTMAASYVENSDSTKADDAGDSEKPKAKRDEKRMEINRQRAKEIRKRKKKMVEDMQKQIIYLTLENNKFRTQTQMQQAEINLLRSTTHKNLGNTTAAPHHHQVRNAALGSRQIIIFTSS